MRFIQGQNRKQTHLFPISLDESIGKDNEVRLIDLFVDSLDLSDFGFMMLVAYNLRRLINIIGKNELIKYLGEILSFYQLKNLLIKLKIYILSYLFYNTKYYSYFPIKGL